MSRRSTEILWGVFAATLVAAATLPYTDGVAAGFSVPRIAVFYPLAALWVGFGAWSAATGRAPVRIDRIDLSCVAFALWALVTTVAAPVTGLAWWGAYGRGTGAVFWISCASVFLVARRVLAAGAGRGVLRSSLAVLLIVEVVVAGTQTVGLDTPWGVGLAAQGRMSGTMGNPVFLAGLALSAVWLGGPAILGSRRPAAGSWLQIAGACAGLLAVVSTVSRAAYLALAVGAAVITVPLALERRWSRVALVVLCVLALALGSVAFSTVTEGAGGSLIERLANEGIDTRSDRGRFEAWRAGLDAVGARPLFGFGPGAYSTAYRLLVSPEQLRAEPYKVVSDPHDLPILLASGMGVPGLLLGLTLAGLLLSALVRRTSSQPIDDDRAHRFAMVAYAGSAATFLLFSPLDLGTLLPVALALGVTLPAASGSPVSSHVSTALGVRVAVAVVAAGAFVSAFGLAIHGVTLWRADAALLAHDRTGALEPAVKAARSGSSEPYYALVAGHASWRVGLERSDAHQLAQGELFLREALRRDPFLMEARLELARLYVETGREAVAAGEVQLGLRDMPHHPIAQGLLGYAAYRSYLRAPGSVEGDAMVVALEALPADTADGWYWIARAKEARGDLVGARLALERSEKLDPAGSEDRYLRRVTGDLE
ncbi:MAG: O-antigen ligase family protein [Actinobacteria bacterium]|nr:O-antigen ligase family protein [Actinomycetota bacterium]